MVYFDRYHNDDDEIETYAKERGIELLDCWYVVPNLVRMALWEFSLPLDDPIADTLRTMARSPTRILCTLRRKGHDTSGYADKSLAEVATLFLQTELQRRGTVQERTDRDDEPDEEDEQGYGRQVFEQEEVFVGLIDSD